MQNKPNFRKAEMNTTYSKISCYDNFYLRGNMQNKANSNPIKANSNPIKPNFRRHNSRKGLKFQEISAFNFWQDWQFFVLPGIGFFAYYQAEKNKPP
jgi:hypothetical protein